MADSIPSILIQAKLRQDATTQINKQIEEIQKQAKLQLNVDIDTKTAKQAIKDLQNQPILQMKSDQLNSRIQTWMSNNTKAAKMYDTQLQQILTSTKEVNSRSDLTNVSQQFKTVQRNAEALGVTGDTVFEKFKSDLGNFTTFLSAGALIVGGISQIKQIVSTVSDLNEAATQIQMATGGTARETANLIKQYNSLATELGATTIEVTASADSFLRQGKSVSDTNELIKDSMTLSKIGQLDSAEATTYLTSVTKGYNVAVKDTMGVVDALSAVDMQSATSAGGLAEALSKTSNVANLSGVSMNKLIGYVATVGEVTQKSMDEVGTSFQAIFSRMGNIKAGKFISDDGEDLNDVQTVLGKVGIKLKDGKDSFRNFGDVLDDVANKWKTFTDVEKNAVGTAIAGKQAVCSNIQQCIALAV